MVAISTMNATRIDRMEDVLALILDKMNAAEKPIRRDVKYPPRETLPPNTKPPKNIPTNATATNQPTQPILPQIYYPRGGALMNPFSQLKFNGSTTSKVHPIQFLRKFQHIAEFERIPDNQQLHFMENCLCDQAATWWAGKCFANMEAAIRSFRSKYWSDAYQTEFSRKLHNGDNIKRTTVR